MNEESGEFIVEPVDGFGMSFGSSDEISDFISELRVQIFNDVGHDTFGLNGFIVIHLVVSEGFIAEDMIDFWKIKIEFKQFFSRSVGT